MNRLSRGSLSFFTLLLLLAMAPAALAGVVRLVSPDHGQTFSYGSEQTRQWGQRGRHLVLYLSYTNDPYVDRINPRQYDYFTFSFPNVTLGRDGHTFFYGGSVPIAREHSGFLGIQEINLLPNAVLDIRKPHGYLTVAIEAERL